MQGLLLHAIVHSAGVQDRDGGIWLLTTLFGQFPRMGLFFVKEFKSSASFLPSSVSLFDLKPVSSSRPALRSGRRAQELSRLAVAPNLRHAPPLQGHTLTARSTMARLMQSG
jgi:hypothetical protein